MERVLTITHFSWYHVVLRYPPDRQAGTVRSLRDAQTVTPGTVPFTRSFFALFQERSRSVAEVAHGLLSSISRLCRYRTIPTDVCDAQYPIFRPSYGPEIDVTVAASP